MPSRTTNDHSFLVPETEKKLYYLLNKIGVISGGQIQAHRILHKSPKTSRKILAKLRRENKIAEHTLTVGSKDYKLYTLGPAGAAAIKADYRPDYWYAYSESEAIQKLLTLELYIRLCDYLSADLKVEPGEKPYTYTFIHGDKAYNIGVVWDNAVSFMETYRWSPPRERVILICQNIDQLNCLLEYLEEYTPIRAATREKLKEGLVFYKPENGKWVLDLPDKKIKTKPAEKKIVNRQRIFA